MSIKRKSPHRLAVFALIAALLCPALFSCGAEDDVSSSTSEPASESIVFMKTDAVELDREHFTYFFYSTLSRIYTDYLQQGCTEDAGLDISKPLAEQYYWSSSQTWRDFMISYSINELAKCLVLCTAAASESFILSTEETESINASIAEIEDYMEKENVTAAELFGDPSVTSDDIRYVMTLQRTASNYSSTLANSFKFTDEEYEEYYQAHKEEKGYTDDEYLTACVYVLSVSKSAFESNAEWQLAADTLMNVSFSGNVEDFLALADEYAHLSVAKSGLRSNLKKGDIKSILNIDAFDDWAFDDGISVGDTKCFIDADGDLCALFFYEGAGLSARYAQADADMRSDTYTLRYTLLEKSFPVTVYYEKLPVIN